MKKVTIGITAHVDAGKTTLAEAILYRSGKPVSYTHLDVYKRQALILALPSPYRYIIQPLFTVSKQRAVAMVFNNEPSSLQGLSLIHI